MIELENVAKSYGSVRALHPLSISFAPTAKTVLIGPSGCGKSTILRLINGLTRPASGIVRFERVAVGPENIRSVRRRMGYVIQEGGLFPHLTGRQNVTLMARRLRWPASQIGDRITELAELVHIPSGRLDHFPAQLSGGQRQRVSLMRALMLDPDVLLLDEPLGALDPMIRAGLQNELRRIFRTLKKTVVMVTHDIGEAAYFADRIALLRSGRIVQTGTIRDLLDHPSDPFVEAFIRAQRSPIDGIPDARLSEHP